MAVLKCKMCGGDIIAEPNATYGTCDSCGTTMTLPRLEDEMQANRFNRANHFRRQNEFDKAIDAYVCYISENEKDYAFNLLHYLRSNNIKSDMNYLNRGLKGQFKEADNNNARFVIIIGEEEKNSNVLTIKNNITKNEYKIKKEEIVKFIREN